MSPPTAAAPAFAGRAGSPPAALLGLGQTFLAERQRWILWIPVFVGIGIAVYFTLPEEPAAFVGAAAVLTCGLLVAATCVLAPEQRVAAQPLAIALLAMATGLAAAQAKALLVAPTTLAQRIGPTELEGRVDASESFPDGQRLTLDALSIPGLDPAETPQRVRLRLRGDQPVIRPGDRVTVRAMLMPPPAPAVPGGYDFQRQAFFDGLGAVGYSVGHARVLTAGRDPGSVGLWFAKLRFAVGERVRRLEPGATGAVMIALLTGEQRAIPDSEMAAIRDSGLAHLLSISGLHIGLVAGLVFLAVRSGLALVPRLALRYPIKKCAAVVSVLAAGAYTVLAAAPVPSQRSFLMIAIVLIAVLVDRQGISIRLVAFSALVILLTQPESMLGPSFQMSFAAVTALIVSYEEMRDRRRPDGKERSAGRRAIAYLGGVVLSTLIAGSATAPFAAYHFNRFQVYGVVANMIAVPVTGFWIMPFALVSALLMPFGLESLALLPMAWGVEIVLEVARTVASWPGAVILLPPMPPWGLCLVALGGLWVCLWRRQWRWLGALAMAAGLASVTTTRVPDLLIDGSGRLMAVRSDDGGLLFSSRSAARAAREAWLRRAGVAAPAGVWARPGAALLAPLRCDSVGCVLVVQGRRLAIAERGEALPEDCRRADVVVSLVPVRISCPSATVLIDRFNLWRDGTHALWVNADGVRMQSVGSVRGNRPWVIAPRRTAGAGRALARSNGSPTPQDATSGASNTNLAPGEESNGEPSDPGDGGDPDGPADSLPGRESPGTE